MPTAKLLATIFVTALAVGCAADEADRELEMNAAPGEQPWNADDILCQSAADCGPGEFCGEGGACQMLRCDGAYDSMAPMGLNHYFGVDGELAIISDGTFVDGFEAADGSYLSSWNLDGERIVDVAGGGFNGLRPQAMAVAIEDSDEVTIRQGDRLSTLSVGIWPRVLAAGDTDADGLDELLAFSDDGSIALCHVEEDRCELAQIDGAEGKDVAVADVDGDGYHEPVFLFEYEDSTELIVWNTDAELTGQDASYGWRFNFGIKAIAAADVDGDLVAEVLALEDGGWFGLASDTLHVFSPKLGEIIADKSISKRSSDVAAGDRDSDGLAEIAVLRSDHKFELLQIEEAGTLGSVGTWDVTVGDEAERISMLDWDGDSASARAMDGPALVSGLEVPTMVMLFPPYPRGAANAPLNASVGMGNTESHSEALSDTVSLSVGLAVSFGADFGSIAKAKVGAYFNYDTSVSRTQTKSLSVGARYSSMAAPDLHGTDYAAVLLTCGCYHRYGYEIDDPAGKLGGTGQEMDIFVPVGGNTLLLSSTRYNAMAEALPHLPRIESPVRIGDVDSYPTAPTKLDGSPVPEEDLLFPETPVYNASDVGFVTFWLTAGEQETNSVNESISIGVSGSLGAFGVSVDSKIGVGVAQGYSVTVGKSATFSGSVPPIPDDPATPEDEYSVHRYAFKPIVYREHYQTPDGEDAGYYVMTYTASR